MLDRVAHRRFINFMIGLLQVILDAFLLYSAFCLSYYIRFHTGWFSTPKGIPAFDLYQINFPIATLVMLLVHHSLKLYDRRGYEVRIRAWQVFKASLLGIFVLMSITFIYRDVTFSRLLFAIAWSLSYALILFSRWIVRSIERYMNRRFQLSRKVMLISSAEYLKTFIQGLSKTKTNRIHISGILLEKPITDTQYLSYLQEHHVRILGNLEQFSEVLSAEKADEVILAIPDLNPQKTIEIILACEKELVQFRMVPSLFEILTSQVELENFYGVTLIGLKQFPLERVTNRILKRIVDVAGALVAAILGLPLFIVITLLIKRDSKGPIFYFQERMGEDGKIFRMIKFRTMVQNAEEDTGPVWAEEDDPRRTKIGSFLRRWNLDELPQVINVLKGNMSLVGPRPERPHFVTEFKESVPRYMSRHKVKSGMTGWAQVNGLRGNTSVVERIKFDIYYLEHWSIWFDLQILLRTFFAKKNAY